VSTDWFNFSYYLLRFSV